MKRRSKFIGVGVILVVGTIIRFALRERKNPAPHPYEQRLVLKLPRLSITQSRLRETLNPASGERILEVGPGTGRYSLSVAQWLHPDGQLHIFDIQQRMLDHTVQRARNQGITNISTTRGDAEDLPYPDDSFDAVYLVGTLGEIPNQDQALREFHRVLQPNGRLVVGEALPDPDMVRFGTLRHRSESSGFEFEQQVGGRFGYFAKFQKSTKSSTSLS